MNIAWCLVLGILFNFSARAEHSSLPLMIAPALIGVTPGRPAEDKDFPAAVKITRKRPDGKDSLCTGVIVEGCILTASHCLTDNWAHEISVGANPQAALTFGTKLVRWGDGKTPATDLAIIKPNLPPPASSGITRDSLARKPLAKGDLFHITGYGIPGTTVENGVRKNLPAGKKQWGQSRVKGFGEDGGEIRDEGSLMVSERAPDIVTPGDSGGIAVKDGILYGITTVVKPEFALRKDEKPPEGELLVDNITHGYHVSLGRKEAREWITKSLDDLDCRANLRESVELGLRDLMRENIAGDRWQEKWKRLDQGIVDKMKDQLRRLLNLPPTKPLWLVAKAHPKHAFDFDYQVGNPSNPEEAGRLEVELDTGKVTITPVDAADIAPSLPPDFEVKPPSPVVPPEERIPRDKLKEPLLRLQKVKS